LDALKKVMIQTGQAKTFSTIGWKKFNPTQLTIKNADKKWKGGRMVSGSGSDLIAAFRVCR
jgi:hypothetical protein